MRMCGFPASFERVITTISRISQQDRELRVASEFPCDFPASFLRVCEFPRDFASFMRFCELCASIMVLMRQLCFFPSPQCSDEQLFDRTFKVIFYSPFFPKWLKTIIWTLSAPKKVEFGRPKAGFRVAVGPFSFCTAHPLGRQNENGPTAQRK